MFKYIPKSERNNEKSTNKAKSYTSNMLKSDFNKYGNNKLNEDYKKILNNGCVYIPNYYCNQDDMTIFNKLREEIKTQDPINWSKHMKYENPTFSDTFNEIVNKLSIDFKLDIKQTRLNYYRNGSDWKPLHHDSHAYGNKEENYTLGVSFGASRIMEFVQDDINTNDTDNLKEKFIFPQNNGDIFGFTKEVNQKFMHGIQKDNKQNQERLSIIVWGKKLN